jgi:hypothetical protein
LLTTVGLTPPPFAHHCHPHSAVKAVIEAHGEDSHRPLFILVHLW